jgi:hypothetical protein
MRMHTRLLSTATVAAVVAVAAGPSASGAQPKTVICGQIKHGPHAAYTSLLTRKKLNGSTWTVFATGVPCAKAMPAARAILRWWRTAKIESSILNVRGFACTKESDGHGSSGTAGCSYRGLSNIELMMTGSASIAQLKQMFFIK